MYTLPLGRVATEFGGGILGDVVHEVGGIGVSRLERGGRVVSKTMAEVDCHQSGSIPGFGGVVVVGVAIAAGASRSSIVDS